MVKKYKEWEGKEFTSIDGYKYRIVRYVSKEFMQVRFEDGTTKEISRQSAINQTLSKIPKKVYGIGVADYSEDSLPEVKDKWRGILRRSIQFEKGYISNKNQKAISSYSEVTICEEWLTFSNFEKWMLTHNWEGKDLDKDLLGNGKHYSPDTCCFLPHQVNIAIQTRENTTEVLGVSAPDKRGLFRVSTYWKEVRQNSKSFRCIKQAHKYWQENKINSLLRMVDEYYTRDEISTRVRDKLLDICCKIQEDIDLGRFTTSIV